ncbi:MAG TPA: lysylphosphatidylglycerol synthase transmembrane domain-containing protein [Polyangiaceae bacterium]|nr:lysylphosphatidylglycerol synthase transmembrane domain-containing protein [Polyangiaceae bacterium]
MNRFVRRLLFATLLGVLVYGAFALYTGLARMQESLSAFQWSHFGWALALASTNYLIRYLKWEYYLRRLGIRGVAAMDSLLVFLSGFVLTVTPGKVGEVFKSAVLFRTHDVPVARTAPIVVAERLTDALGVVVLIVLGSTTFTGGGGWALAGGLAVATGVLAIVWEAPVQATLRWLGRRGGKLAGLVPKLSEAYASLRVVAGPAALLIPTFLSCIAWGLEGIALYLILRGFGADVPLPRAAFFYSTATLAGALVPLPGGLGIVEGIIREQLVHVSHMQEGPATASMILIRFATLWWAVLVGFAALLVLRIRFKERLADGNALAEAGAGQG